MGRKEVDRKYIAEMYPRVTDKRLMQGISLGYLLHKIRGGVDYYSYDLASRLFLSRINENPELSLRKIHSSKILGDVLKTVNGIKLTRLAAKNSKPKYHAYRLDGKLLKSSSSLESILSFALQSRNYTAKPRSSVGSGGITLNYEEWEVLYYAIKNNPAEQVLANKLLKLLNKIKGG